MSPVRGHAWPHGPEAIFTTKTPSLTTVFFVLLWKRTFIPETDPRFPGSGQGPQSAISGSYPSARMNRIRSAERNVVEAALCSG